MSQDKTLTLYISSPVLHFNIEVFSCNLFDSLAFSGFLFFLLSTLLSDSFMNSP